MKKILALLLVLTMVFAMAACGGNNENTKPTGESTPSTNNTENTGNVDNTDNTESTGDSDEVTVMTHAEFDAAELDSKVMVECYVSTIESWWEGKCHIYGLAEDGGYYIYGYECTEDEAAKLVPGTKILVTGYKTEWSGEVEIVDATVEILEGTAPEFTPEDVTALVGTDDLAKKMNGLVAMNGVLVASKDANGNEVPFLYKWDGSGSQGDDIYFNLQVGDTIVTCTINAYMVGTGSDSYVYQTLEVLEIGTEMTVEGFLYWYNGAQPHVTNVITAG